MTDVTVKVVTEVLVAQESVCDMDRLQRKYKTDVVKEITSDLKKAYEREIGDYLTKECFDVVSVNSKVEIIEE